MNTLTLITIATTIVSLGSLIGIFTITLNQQLLHKYLLNLVALSAGTMLAGALLHLLPESVNQLGSYTPFLVTLISFIGFFLIEHVLLWHHCHDLDHCERHTLGYMNLFGDVIHNFIDGLVIAGAFTASITLGFTTTLAVILHEIPQEIGDFGVLLHSGFSRQKALFLNFLVGLSSILGGIAGYFLTHAFTQLTPYLLPIAAGGFIYISASDLLPELKIKHTPVEAFSLAITFIIGVTIMFVL